MIYDGNNPSAPILSRLTGNILPYNNIKNTLMYNSKAPIISTQNHLYIYFFTNQQQSLHKGFSISYKKGCNNVIRSLYGNIVSPGYLKIPYPTTQICKYTIELPDAINEQAITLSVNQFEIAFDDVLRVINFYFKIKKLN